VWHAEIPVEQVRGVFRSEGWKAPAHIDAVRVTKRTDAGRAVQLEFAGDGATVPVTASSFRFAMDRMLGWNQLRSDWFTVTLSSDALHFEGHGYGHGVGLCQAGATEMAAEGHSAPEILSFYFPGTRVGVTAEDRGWSAARGTGWTLFAPQGRVQPEVWEMPSTELFRQTTAEPGWMLASSAGTRVFLQPEAVLNQNRGEGLTLVHEFLHVLVESEAAAQAPLWLREGVVEALAQDSDSSDGAGRTVSMAALEAALTRPASQAESQWAHVAAKKMARAMIAQFGLAQVRQWLRTGSVPEAVVMRVQASR
jgi:stage II sporulation protein D